MLFPTSSMSNMLNSSSSNSSSSVCVCVCVSNLSDNKTGVSQISFSLVQNALWLATSWCLLLFLPAICLGLALARFFLRMDYDDDTLPL